MMMAALDGARAALRWRRYQRDSDVKSPLHDPHLLERFQMKRLLS